MIIISVSMISTIVCLKLHHSSRRDGKPMSTLVNYSILLDFVIGKCTLDALSRAGDNANNALHAAMAPSN